MQVSFKKIVRNIYVLFLMGFTVWYGYFMYPLIFGFEEKEEAGESLLEMLGATSEDEILFASLVVKEEETETIDLGYRVIDQPYIKGRFHHIGFSIESDVVSICVTCHGAVPHDASMEIRSFLNMHAFYIGCETCHMYPQDDEPPLDFRWYDKLDGKTVPNPTKLVDIENSFTNMEGFESKYVTYGNYGAKIGPGKTVDGNFEFLKRGNMMNYVLGYLEQQLLLSESQQSQAKSVIHRDINAEPIECEACHNNTQEYIPFAQLGYPPRRVEELTNTAVVGMIKKYEEFWIPDLLSPGQRD